ncbi:MAG: O-antigen ligase family protein [Planctomycetaceae bacterium]|nr:O-antigen ligase family protein [Planctomycetaceae bacterium]
MIPSLINTAVPIPKRSIAARLPHLGWGVAVTILCGCVFGYEFFHKSALSIDRVLVGCVVAWLFLQLVTKRIELPTLEWTDLFVIGFMGLIGLNLLVTDWRYENNKPLTIYIFYYLVPFAFYFVMRCIGHDPRTWKILQWCMIGLGVYLAATGLCEARGWTGLVFPKYILDPTRSEFLGRGRGPFLNPIANGVVQISALAYGLVLWKNANSRGRMYVFGFAVLMLIGIWATLTRSNWLAAAPLVALYVWRNSSWTVRGLCVLAVPFVLIFGYVTFGDKINSFKRDKDVSVEDMSESAELRPFLAIVAKKMVADRPLMGFGFTQYSKHAKPYHFNAVEGDRPLQRVMKYVQHNTYLAYAVELGVIGLSVFLLIIGPATWMSLRLWLHPELPDEIQNVGFVAFATILGFAINGMFHDVAIIVMTNMLLYTTIGLLVAVYSHAFRPRGLNTG